jgi:hypothetical protein
MTAIALVIQLSGLEEDARFILTWIMTWIMTWIQVYFVRILGMIRRWRTGNQITILGYLITA